MKIVNLETFLNSPKGTIFQKWEPNIFEPLCIFENSCGNNEDFLYREFRGNVEFPEEHANYGTIQYYKKEIPNMENLYVDFNCVERDGCFDHQQMFAIYEKKDLKEMIQILQNNLS